MSVCGKTERNSKQYPCNKDVGHDGDCGVIDRTFLDLADEIIRDYGRAPGLEAKPGNTWAQHRKFLSTRLERFFVEFVKRLPISRKEIASIAEAEETKVADVISEVLNRMFGSDSAREAGFEVLKALRKKFVIAEIPAKKEEADPNQSTVRSIPNDVLVRRAVRSALPRSFGEVPRWSAVADAFGLGSTFATELCRIHGIDPHEKMRRTACETCHEMLEELNSANKAHETITSLALAEGATTADGTSVSAVRNLIKTLRGPTERIRLAARIEEARWWRDHAFDSILQLGDHYVWSGGFAGGGRLVKLEIELENLAKVEAPKTIFVGDIFFVPDQGTSRGWVCKMGSDGFVMPLDYGKLDSFERYLTR